MKDYYYLLGLNRNASDDDIKKAYRKLSKKFHPDVNDGDLYFTERFKDIQEAYEVLSDSKLKLNYDNLRSGSSENIKTPPAEPEILLFTADKDAIKIGEKITFNWSTINGSSVFIEPLGKVELNGRITYKINDSKFDKIDFVLKVLSNQNKIVAKETISISVLKPKSNSTVDSKVIESDAKKNKFDPKIESPKIKERDIDKRLVPCIDKFECIHKSGGKIVSVGDEILVNWNILNADSVLVNPIGGVGSFGSKIIIVKPNNENTVKIYLSAINLTSGCRVEKDYIFTIDYKQKFNIEKSDSDYRTTVYIIVFTPIIILLIILLAG